MEISWGYDVNVIWIWSMDWSGHRLGFCHHWVQHRLNDRFRILLVSPFNPHVIPSFFLRPSQAWMMDEVSDITSS